MRHYLKIGDTEFSSCSELQVIESVRAESVKTTLSGAYLIDRVGSPRLSVTAKITMLSEKEMVALRTMYTNVKADVSFFYGSAIVTKSMRIKPFKQPAPTYYYGDRANGYMYKSVTVEMEEM